MIVDCGAAWRATGSVAFVRDGKVGFFFLSFVLAGSAPSLSLSLSFSLLLSLSLSASSIFLILH